MNRYVLLTGVSKGLGLVLLKKLLSKSYNVLGISRSRNNDIDILIKQYTKQFIFLQIDLSDIKSVKEISEFIREKDIQLGAFINNAAVAYDDIITNIKYDQLEKMFKTNVFTPILLTKLVIRNFLLHDFAGSIVHLSSISVHTGYKGLSMYAASKSALEAFSKNSAREWGEKGIRSNCLVSGFMNTDMSSSLSVDQKNRIFQRTSLKKPTDLSSVSDTIEFLISDRATSITGQNIFVDSGTL